MKHKIQVVGNFLDGLNAPLYRENIAVESIISGINPLAICDTPDETLCYEPDDKDTPVTLLNVRKNFDCMLARTEEKFNSNVFVQPRNERVRDINRSDYIVVWNNMFNYLLLRVNGVIYSNCKNSFVKQILDEHCEKISYPFPEGFDWRENYIKFIDTITQEYPADHIILIKSSVSPYVFDNSLAAYNTTKWDDYAVLVHEADELFAKRTNCICIDDLASAVPCEKPKGTAPFCRYSAAVTDGLARRIKAITDGGADNAALSEIIKNSTLRQEYYPHILSDIRSEAAALLSGNTSEQKQAAEELSELNSVLERSNCFSFTELCSFRVLKDEELVKLAEKYFRFFRFELNDILSLFSLYQKNKDSIDFSVLTRLVLESTESVPVRNAGKLYSDNLAFLKEYKYISTGLTSECGGEQGSICLPLNNGWFLVVSLDSDELFSVRYIEQRKQAIFAEACDRGLELSPESVYAVLSDYRFYLDRARAGAGAKPIKLVFETAEQFNESLWTTDWRDVIANEPYIITDGKSVPDTAGWTPVCDLSFLLTGEARIFIIRAGLADQMCYYLWSKYVEQHSKKSFSCYYDDIAIKAAPAMCPLELPKVVAEDLAPKLISNRLSPKLIIRSREISMRFADVLALNGCEDVGVIGTDDILIKSAKAKIYKFTENERNKMCNVDCRLPYYHMVMRPDTLKSNLGGCIKVQALDEQNEALIKEMQSVDSVVVHIRRGDFVTYGIAADMDFYKESMAKLASFPDYANKKFYVFSDDIPWCRTHTAEIGFDEYFPSAQISYVTHNRADDDYKDMLLMAHGKVIIGSNSGFVRMAAWMSKSCEVFMCYNLDTTKSFEKNVRKNKYRIGRYKKKYTTIWGGGAKSVDDRSFARRVYSRLPEGVKAMLRALLRHEK